MKSYIALSKLIGERSEPLSDKLGGEICIATRALVCIYIYIHPFSLHFEHPGVDCVPAAAVSVRVYSKKTYPTYVHYQLFKISFIVCWFSFAGLLSLSCNRISRMS